MSIHIAFLSLFLSLASGRHEVELSLGGSAAPVAAVEILLDGRTAATLESPPWKAKVDFGPTLLPHELVARALDAEGRELARARQWVNLPRPPAEVEIAFEGEGVRLSWQQVTYERPSEIRLSLDGAPLAVDPGGRAALPAVDPGQTHVLTAELRFPSGAVARRDVVFGGERGETFTELTAVPLRVLHGGDLPALDKLQGWFLAGGRPVKVAAVEDEVGELFVVRVPDRVETRARLGPGMVVLDNRLRNYLKLGKNDQVRFVSPRAHVYHQGTASSTRVHDVTRGTSTLKDGLYFLLVDRDIQRQSTGTPRAADAVAVAGLTALAGEHRRAVLLVLGEKPQDASFYKPDEIRRYLEAIRVPLFVWSLGDPKSNPGLAAWGVVEDVTSSRKLNLAFERIRNELRAQRVVWVEGRHLPQSIALAPQAAGIELVAGPPLP